MAFRLFAFSPQVRNLSQTRPVDTRATRRQVGSRPLGLDWYSTMIPPIPRLEDYGISPERGFLPSELPLQCLSHPVYDRWERIMNNFQSLLLSKRLRTVIDKLPIIPAVHLETESEWRRAYTVLTFLAHGYIWGGEKPSEVCSHRHEHSG